MPLKKPLYTMIPNELLGEPYAKKELKRPGAMAEMGLAELKVILAIMRATLGYHHAHARVSVRRVAAMTGLSKQGVSDGAKMAEAHGWLVRFQDGGVTRWGINAPWTEGYDPDEFGGVQASRTPVQASGTPSIKENEKENLLPATSSPAIKGDYFTVTEELEYTDPEDDVSSPPRGPTASTPEQAQWLNATGAKSFQPGHKSKVKSILASVKRGDALGAMKGDIVVYQQCLKELGSINAAALRSPPSILPQSWLEDRYKNAKKYTWTRDNLLDNTLKRESLVDHCRRMLSKAGGSAVEESPEEYAARTGKVVYQ